jgi:hypothetical protein
MLVTNVSLARRRATIAAEVAEAAAAIDSSTLGNIVFATLVDDPASVGELVDAYLGEIMMESAGAVDSADAALPISATIAEAAAADSAQSVAAAVTAATWNPADKSSAMTLSNGNMTASQPASAGYQFVRSTTSKSTGKLYCEITWGASVGGGGNDGIGIATSSATSSWVAGGTGGLVYWSSGSAFFNGGPVVSGLGSCSPGDVCCFAIDLANNRIWSRKNAGVWNSGGSDNPATNVGGVDISALFPTNPLYMHFGSTGNWSASSCTINFGATAFAQAVPSGFTAWG